MADKTEQTELNKKLLDAISKKVTVITNYWGEYEEINQDSLNDAAKACEQLIISNQPEEIKNISIKFAEWMHSQRLTGNWNENYDYFLKNIYNNNSDHQAIKPALIIGLRN